MLDSKKNFIKKCQENLNIAQSVRQRDKASISLKDNRELIVHEFEKYDTSFLNPTYLHALQIPQPGLMSVVYDMFLRTTSLALLNRPIFVWEKNMLLLKIEEFFDYGDLDALISSLGEINLKIMESRIEHNVIESVNSNNIFTEILMEANDTHFDWLARYGKAISRKDIHMAKHWFALSDKELQRIAKHIADAFFHGFISQSRQIAGRSNVRLLYSIGQEAIAKQVFQEFMERGISPIPLEPQSTSIPYVYELDHRFDEMLNNYVSSQDMLNQFYENSMQKYQQSVENICGFVRVSSFGREAKASRSQYAFEPPQKMRDAYQQYQSHVRDVESRILRPDRLSFCSVAFPDIDIGKDFSDIFEEFMHINTEDSAHYEEIQQQLIDILDTCDSVHIQGLGLNKTDIHICFRKELDAKTQSNFLNCGGDLNIPYGEVFTTPSLTGTEGVYFVNEIFIQNNYYKICT